MAKKLFIMVVICVIIPQITMGRATNMEMQSDSVKCSIGTIAQRMYISSRDSKPRYIYTFVELKHKVDSIKKSKLSFCQGYRKYPLFMDPQKVKEEDKEFTENMNLAFKSLKPNIDMSIFLYCETLLNDDGSVICFRLHTTHCLYDYFSAEEIAEALDRIDSYRYCTPLTYENSGWSICTVWFK